jgi:hypothetical protein
MDAQPDPATGQASLEELARAQPRIAAFDFFSESRVASERTKPAQRRAKVLATNLAQTNLRFSNALINGLLLPRSY